MIASLSGRSVGRLPALLILFSALLAVSSCIQDDIPSYRSIRSSGRNSISIDKEEKEGQEELNLFFTTVEFPSGYDWRRDSLYGSSGAKIGLYKNEELILEVPTGDLADAAADLHHFIDGHLYTQKCTGKGTVLACDGEEILRFGSEEILRGLYSGPEGLYTLWANRSGSGFCLRLGSSEVFRKDTGTLVGNLYDYSYLPNGALYEDNGGVVFCYYSGDDWFCFRNDNAEKISAPAGTVLDVKVANSKFCILCRPTDGNSLLFKCGNDIREFRSEGLSFRAEGRIFLRNGNPICMANAFYRYQSSVLYSALFFPDGSNDIISGSDAVPLSFSDPKVFISYSEEGRLSFSVPSYGYVNPEGTFYQMGGSPGVCSKDIAVAFNSKIKGKKPVLWKNGQFIQLNINGFISGVYTSTQTPPCLLLETQASINLMPQIPSSTVGKSKSQGPSFATPLSLLRRAFV